MSTPELDAVGLGNERAMVKYRSRICEWKETLTYMREIIERTTNRVQEDQYPSNRKRSKTKRENK